MPFRAQCLFCGHEVLAPDHALGGSACCPKCSSFFTLAPAAQVKGTAFSPSADGARTVPAKIVAAAAPIARHTLDSKQASEPGRRAEAGPLPKAALVHPLQGSPAKPRSSDAFGLSALLSGGAALLCASVPSLCRLVLPVAALGLLLGAAGLFLVLRHGGMRLLFPVTGTLVAGVVLFTAFLFPGFLGPAFLASRAKQAVDASAIRAVPLPGSLGKVGPADRDWVDASRASLQQGRISVQVVSASIRRVGSKFSPAKKTPPGDYYFIRLRTQQVDASSGSPERPAAPGSPFEKAGPRLTDNSGKSYPLCEVQEVAPAPGARKSSGFPVVYQDRVLVFEAPARPDHLRLEVPAEPLGGKGVFRFAIPSSMIQDERTGPNDGKGRH